MIADEYLPYLWAATAISLFIFLIILLALRRDLLYVVSRFSPRSRYRPQRSPGAKPFAVWVMFIGMGATTLMGAALLAATFQQASGAEPEFIPPPTMVPTPAVLPVTSTQEEPVQVEIRFPSGLTPCTVGTLTLIPEEVDPYSLPLVHPIDPWFENQRFVQTAFAHVRVKNRSLEEDIRLANLVLVKVINRQPIPTAMNAAFTHCDGVDAVKLPAFEVDHSTSDASVWINEERFNDIPPGFSQSLELKLVGVEPGLYEIKLGIQYVSKGEVHQEWGDQTIVVSAPETIHRWSAGIITYWGDCSLHGGTYSCDEYILEEPVLEPAAEPADEEPESGTDGPVCTLSPPVRLEPGQKAVVSQRLGLNLRLRAEPGLDAETYTVMSGGTRLTIMEGPVCKDGYWWFKVQAPTVSKPGWMAEGEPRIYYLDPIR